MDYVIKKDGDKEYLYAEAEINLGEIKKQISDDGSFSMPMSVEFTKQLMKESIIRNVKEENDEGFEEALREYSKCWVSELLGVKNYPIQENDGKIKGLIEELDKKDLIKGESNV
jgi:hypothetical protein